MTAQSHDFEDIYKSYYALVFSSVYSKVSNFDEAEDICQEVFIRLYQNLEKVETPRKWLYGTLRNVVLDYYKARNKSEKEIQGLMDEVSIHYTNGFQDTRVLLQEIMDDDSIFQDDTEKVIFELAAVYNYTYAYISESLDLTYRQVRYAFEQITRRIQDSLKRRGISSLEELL